MTEEEMARLQKEYADAKRDVAAVMLDMAGDPARLAHLLDAVTSERDLRTYAAAAIALGAEMASTETAILAMHNGPKVGPCASVLVHRAERG